MNQVADPHLSNDPVTREYERSNCCLWLREIYTALLALDNKTLAGDLRRYFKLGDRELIIGPDAYIYDEPQDNAGRLEKWAILELRAET